MKQILLNLIDNAIEYTNSNGLIKLICRNISDGSINVKSELVKEAALDCFFQVKHKLNRIIVNIN
ncbi:ATP-binding protein [Alkaliphilus sp. B6464]|uniref:ATP-binding protein n=1 Tax=Alkaliphilus sp. B6464 TaxID=2731219 RepID=UPI001BA96E66|nr:ATP-binding protein [Alkaliphilus sp. B6464]QUH19061.1 hypothetical protein HYG84_03615 [Alkaliphilus sp. B6464]